MAEMIALNGIERELLEGMGALPVSMLQRILHHIEHGGQMSAAYGWPEDEDESYAPIGCLAGVGLTKREFLHLSLSSVLGEDLRWVCQNVFSRFAAQWIDDLDSVLPVEALSRLAHLTRLALRRAADGQEQINAGE